MNLAVTWTVRGLRTALWYLGDDRIAVGFSKYVVWGTKWQHTGARGVKESICLTRTNVDQSATGPSISVCISSPLHNVRQKIQVGVCQARILC